MQDVDPAEEYFAAGQAEQALGSDAPESAPYFPASQLVQSVDPVLDWYLPASQVKHEKAPVDGWEDPTGHAVALVSPGPMQ